MKTIFFTFLLVLTSSLTFSQDNGCIYGDCENGFGKQVSNDLTYVGQFKNGQFHGVGNISMNSGGMYTGLWSNGGMQAFGMLYRGDESLVIGQFNEGKIEGVAVEYDSDQHLLYRGEFANGEYNGKGYVYIYEEKTIAYVNSKDGVPYEVISQETIEEDNSYKSECISGDCENGLGMENSPFVFTYGEFTNGSINGNGIEMIHGISFYVGEFKDGYKSGTGHSITMGTHYIGEFLNDKRHGAGKLYENDGSYYEGHFIENNKEGFGMYYDQTGSKIFEGYFSNNEIHGTGELYDYENNEIITSTWENGEIVSVIARTPMEETSDVGKISPILKNSELTYKTCASEDVKSICLFPILNQKLEGFKSDGYSGTELYKKLADEIRIISGEYDSRVATETLILSDIIKDDDLTSGMVEQFSAEEQEVIFGHINDIQKELE